MSVSDSTYRTTLGDRTNVLERVLMAIIKAHTTGVTEDRQAERLQTAITALIGPTARDDQDVEQALLFMVRQRQKDICDVEMHALRSCAGAPRCAPRTILELAMLAAREVLGCTTAGEAQAIARALSKIFRKRNSACDAEPDYVREALEAEAVQRIIDELEEWDVFSVTTK